MQPGETPGEGIKLMRNIYERKAYAARRAIMAIDRFSSTTSSDSVEEHVRALRWMKLWMNFATQESYAPSPRHHQRPRQIHIDRGNVAGPVPNC